MNVFTAPQPRTVEPVLPVYYDLSMSPITFDAAVFFAIAAASAQLVGMRAIDVNIVATRYRNLTLREVGYDMPTREWRLHNIIFRLATLLPMVRNITVHRADSLVLPEKRYPADYDPRNQTFQPYNSKLLFALHAAGADVQVYRPSQYAREWAASQFRDPERAVVLSIRNTGQDGVRDTAVEDWLKLYDHLTAKGYDVLVVPDQSDALSGGGSLNLPWRACPQAAMDLDLRLGLYRACRMNLAWAGGYVGLLYLSRSPFRMYGAYNEASPNGNLAYYQRFGFEVGKQPAWLDANQQYLWKDAREVDLDYLIAEADMALRDI